MPTEKQNNSSKRARGEKELIGIPLNLPKR